MAIHCCAMQGRVDAIELLLKHDKSTTIRKALDSEELSTPPSLIHLAIANDHLDCARWFVIMFPVTCEWIASLVSDPLDFSLQAPR